MEAQIRQIYSHKYLCKYCWTINNNLICMSHKFPFNYTLNNLPYRVSNIQEKKTPKILIYIHHIYQSQINNPNSLDLNKLNIFIKLKSIPSCTSGIYHKKNGMINITINCRECINLIWAHMDQYI